MTCGLWHARDGETDARTLRPAGDKRADPARKVACAIWPIDTETREDAQRGLQEFPGWESPEPRGTLGDQELHADRGADTL